MNYEIQIKKLLNITIAEKASDLHISVGHKPILRITRKLIRLEKEKIIVAQSSEDMAFALMNERQKEKFLREKEIDFAYDLDNIARFRVNVFFQRGTVSIAFRLIPSEIKTIEELNLPSILHKFSKATQGFVLITGSSSQGKSTTLACLINEINNNREEHIITIENPIEYVFKDNKSIIDQREVYEDTLSFSRALRATLREDPDVIMVGELRDLETIATAITAAETGHLVFATLHTNSASQTIHRIVDVFPSFQQNQIRAQLTGSLLGIVSQRLVPHIEEGFIPACEIVFANSAVNNLIRENKIHEIPSVIETSREEGMISLNQSLHDLVMNKKIDSEIAIKYSLDPRDLISRLKK